MKLTSYLILVIIIFSSCKEEETKPTEIPTIVENRFDLRNTHYWKISSTPMQFEESALVNDLSYGFNRAKISWYLIDPSVFYDHNSSFLPPNITDYELSNHYVRDISRSEVFPAEEIPNGPPPRILTFNINYFPNEKGPNNYETQATIYSSGINADGNLLDPETRWGGIMSPIPELSYDINYIDFWLMDPFIYNEDISGELNIDLGFISEDALKDNEHSNEASINLNDGSKYDTTSWGIVNTTNSWHHIFSAGYKQDYGLDGLDNDGERIFFSNYLNHIQSICNQDAFELIYADPSGDDYHSFLGDDYDENDFYSHIINRYKKFIGAEGNSDKDVLFPEPGLFFHYSFDPNMEDINEDKNLNTHNAYFEYKINIDFNEMIIGTNYIQDIVIADHVPLPTGGYGYTKWYHFKIPTSGFTDKYGNISLDQKFESMRIYLTNFETQVVLRFATLELTEE